MRPRIHTTHFTRVQVFKGLKDTKPSEKTFLLSVDWQHKKIKLQEKFPQLTEEDLVYEEGKINDLLSRIQIRLSKSRDEVKALLQEL
jgi:uncharacterized protein YjbJ (UPF0337 family)